MILSNADIEEYKKCYHLLSAREQVLLDTLLLYKSSSLHSEKIAKVLRDKLKHLTFGETNKLGSPTIKTIYTNSNKTVLATFDNASACSLSDLQKLMELDNKLATIACMQVLKFNGVDTLAFAGRNLFWLHCKKEETVKALGILERLTNQVK